MRATRTAIDAGPASNVHLDIGCRIAGDLHFRDQAGNGKHQILMQVTSKDSAATVSNSQHGWQQVVPDDGAIGVVLHVDPITLIVDGVPTEFPLKNLACELR